MSISNYMERSAKIAIPTLIMVAIGSIFYMIAVIIDVVSTSSMRVNASTVLIYMGIILMYVMYIVAGFMGIGVAKSMGRTGWKPLILITSILFFLHALLLVRGILVMGSKESGNLSNNLYNSIYIHSDIRYISDHASL